MHRSGERLQDETELEVKDEWRLVVLGGISDLVHRGKRISGTMYNHSMPPLPSASHWLARSRKQCVSPLIPLGWKPSEYA